MARADAPHQPSAESFSSKLLKVTGVVVAVSVFWLTRDIWVLLFGSSLLAVFLSGLTDRVGRWLRLPRGWSLAIVLLVLVALTGLSGWFLGMRFLQQLDEMQTGLSQAAQQIERYVENSRAASFIKSLDWNQQQWSEQLSAVALYLTSGFGGIAAVFLLLIMGIYLAVDPEVYRRGFLALIPAERRQRCADILHQCRGVLWSWLWGRICSMAIIAGATLIGLWLLGIPLALSLALIAFVANFIPYLGPISSAIPALLIALTVSPVHVVYVLLLYAAIQFLETNFVTPLIAQRAVSLPPVFTLSAQMIAGLLFGLVGVVFATPLSAVAVVVVKSLYIEDVLDHKPGHDEPRGGQSALPARL